MNEDKEKGTCELIIYCHRCKQMWQLNPEILAVYLALNLGVWEYYRMINERPCTNCGEVKDWKIVKSKSGHHPVGYPYGEFLCRDQDELESAKKQIHDPVIENYQKNEIVEDLPISIADHYEKVLTDPILQAEYGCRFPVRFALSEKEKERIKEEREKNEEKT